MIEHLNMSNVVGFEHFSNPDPFPGITVILGKNDVCKTALIKMMYAIGKSTELYEKKQIHEQVDFKICSLTNYRLFMGSKKCLMNSYGKMAPPRNSQLK